MLLYFTISIQIYKKIIYWEINFIYAVERAVPKKSEEEP